MCKIEGHGGSEFENVGFLDGCGWICTKVRVDPSSTHDKEIWRIRPPCISETCEVRRPIKHGSAWNSRSGGTMTTGSVRSRRGGCRGWCSGSALETVSEEARSGTHVQDKEMPLAPPGAVAEGSDEVRRSRSRVGPLDPNPWEVLSLPLHQETEWDCSSDKAFNQWGDSERSDSPRSWVDCDADDTPERLSRDSSLGSFLLLDDQTSLSRRSSVGSFFLVEEQECSA
eukprot:TRINITY_DN6909_c0_g1_i1.p1 TRINITY_DN6909_c0_g1~~TRINITY_DN6909_c0_g1_i1.p1  ORF type:complete len:227 (-),score=18.34 TRINITY_DN6909_c0_g1_i1:310-990(-)